MEKIKKLSAALIAMTMACGMMASCGDSNDDSSSKADDKTSAAATESTADESAADGDESAAATDESEGDAPAQPTSYYDYQYEFQGYDAFLMFGDMNWLWGNWNGTGVVHSPDFDTTDAAGYGYGIDADIVGDGEYTVAINAQSIVGNDSYVNPQVALDGMVPASPAEGTVVFCVDIIGLMNGSQISGANKDTGEWEVVASEKNKLTEGDNHYDTAAVGDYTVDDIKVTVTSIKADGVDIDFDASKIRYGNIEDNNNCYRIEIYNSYGTTAADSPIDPMTLTFADSLEVTFTIEGLGEVKTFPEVEAFGAGASAAVDSAAESLADDATTPEEDGAAE